MKEPARVKFKASRNPLMVAWLNEVNKKKRVGINAYFLSRLCISS